MSQSQEILRLLSDGRWWSTAEILREVPCIVHSRISDLRGKGIWIAHRTVGKGAAGSQYRLTGWDGMVPVGEGRLQAARPSHPSGHPLAEGGHIAASRSEASGLAGPDAAPRCVAGVGKKPRGGPPSASGPPASDPESVEARSEQLNLKLGVTV